MSPIADAWFKDGLCFSCTQCGDCCRIEGHVWVDGSEIEALACFLGLDLDTFGRRYLRRVDNRLSLLERANHDCVFWEDGCSVYPVRPRQCRTFPFWSEHLASPESWRATRVACEGIDEGRRYTAAEIDALRRGQGSTRAESAVVDGSD